MGLKSKVQQAAKKAIASLGDLRSDITFRRINLGAYNAATDVVAATNTDYPVQECVLVGLTKSEATLFPPEKFTQKLLIASLDLPIEPLTTDEIHISTVVWQIAKIKTDPARAVWVIFIQEP